MTIQANTIYTRPVFHRDNEQVKLMYKYIKGSEIDKKIRKLPFAAWSRNMNTWYIPYREDYLQYLKDKLGVQVSDLPEDKIQEKKTPEVIQQKKDSNLRAVIIIDKKQKKIQLKLNDDSLIVSELQKTGKNIRLQNFPKWFFEGTNEAFVQIKNLLTKYDYKFRIEYTKEIDEQEDNPIVKHFIQAMMMRNNSMNTIQIYTPFFKDFVNFHKEKEISKLEYNEINSYVQKEIYKKKLSEQQQKQLISSIKYYYEKILGRDKLYFNLNNKGKTIEQKVKIQLNQIIEICNEVKDFKAKMFVILYYSFGLDNTQMSKLTLEEMKSLLKNMPKNNESHKLIEFTKEYYNKYLPKSYFFETSTNDNYSPEQINAVLFGITKKYRLIELYKVEYTQICKELELEQSTTKNYVSTFLTFLKNFDFVHPLTISTIKIRQFLLELTKNEFSKNTINQYINCIKIYYERAYKIELSYKEITRPRKEKKLPVILNSSELTEIFNNIDNTKHKALMLITYSGGLRRSETLNLKVKDIDFERSEIKINKGKGFKDRMALLSESLKPVLKEYINKYKPNEYLFEGATGGKYSATSFAKILKRGIENSGIKKHITLHTLRHSFATHLLEQGTDIRYIQELLGHSDIKTTLLYTQVATKQLKKIKSPLDNMNFDIKSEIKPP